MICNTFKGMKGVTCSTAQGRPTIGASLRSNPSGALYLFPKMKGAPKNYCRGLLEETGICVVPGSGFGTLNEFHIRTTFLPKEEDLEEMLSKWKAYHNKVVKA